MKENFPIATWKDYTTTITIKKSDWPAGAALVAAAAATGTPVKRRGFLFTILAAPFVKTLNLYRRKTNILDLLQEKAHRALRAMRDQLNRDLWKS